ncbi:hypothetical protein BV898_12466 [Hypsibius exemplaris]|uniref:LolA-like domain-containing protein n=1 Tax=Hypsibius exemplaris TaxID=2072580 RepID=A0A1W0WDI0_HYPEX|nr:hypothetical protein BV898_12466 [Hypsibius exemplaris]
MASLLNTLMVLMNYAGGQQVNGVTYFTPLDQVTAKVELVIPAENLVEEFHVTYDRALNLVKYEYSLDPKVPPFKTAHTFKSICDYNTGLAYHMDQSTGTCVVNAFDGNADNSTTTSTRSLLKMLAPEQLFSVKSMMKFINKDKARGISSDSWSLDVSNFYISGYGAVKTRQTLHTLSLNTTKFYRGTARPAIMLQRSIAVLDGRANASTTPVVVLNYFDFFSPATPQIFDFNILSCQPSTSPATSSRGGGQAAEAREEIQLKFSGRLPAAGYSEGEGVEVTTFRRQAWMEFARAAGVSPLRSIGNFWSHDDWNTYFTTVLLPSSPANGSAGTAVQRTADAVEELSEAVEAGGVTVVSGGVTLVAVDLRRNVSLMSSTKGEKAVDVFAVYKAHTTIVGMGVRATVQKLSTKQCTERCHRENSFVCQSAATCGYGDCILSALHGDELLKPSESGASLLANHSHCAVWSRVWTNEYVRVTASVFPEMEPEMTADFAEKEETCAKQCSFPNEEGTDCESFTWCPRASLTPGTKRSPCSLYKHHVFDLSPATAPVDGASTDVLTNSQTLCHYYTRNYLIDFEVLENTALADQQLFETMDVEIRQDFNGGWLCAKACIEKLGDENCHSIEICRDDESYKNRCRISAAFVPLGKRDGAASDRLNLTLPQSDCRVHSRVRYLDGSPVTQRTASNPKVSKVGKRSELSAISVVDGYTGGEMAAMALGMVVIGGVVVALMLIVSKRALPAADVAFARFR